MSQDGHEPGMDRSSLLMLSGLGLALIAGAVWIALLALGVMLPSFWEDAPLGHAIVIGILIAIWLAGLAVTALFARTITRRPI